MNRQFFNNVTFFRNNVIAYFQDYSTLRAKSYANVTLVNKKKNYNCDFCDFVTNLFGNLKIHVRSNHLEPERPVAAAPVLHVSFSNPRARSDESILNSSALETRYQIPYFVCKKKCNHRGEFKGLCFQWSNFYSLFLHTVPKKKETNN